MLMITKFSDNRTHTFNPLRHEFRFLSIYEIYHRYDGAPLSVMLMSGKMHFRLMCCDVAGIAAKYAKITSIQKVTKIN